MKFFISGMKYSLKNVFRFFPFVIITATLCALSMNVFSIWKYLFDASDSISLYELYMGLSLVLSAKWYFSVPAILSLAIIFGLLVCMADRHMRIGRFSFKFYKYFSYAFSVSLPIILILVALFEFLAFILACIIVCFELFIPIYALPYIVMGLYTIGFVIFMSIITRLTFWMPSCIVQGYKFVEGFSSSLRNTKKVYLRLATAWILPCLSVIIIEILGGVFIRDYMIYVNILLYSLMIIYASSLVMSSYLEYNDYERRDIRVKLF